MSNNSMNIGYVSDDGYAKYLPTHIYGLLKNNSDSVVDIYVLTDGISDKHKSDIEKVVNHFQNARVEFVEIDLSIFTDMRIPSFRNLFATYYKLLFEQMLPNVGRLLYLDIDAVVVGNLKELYHTDLGDNYILATNHEMGGYQKDEFLYIYITSELNVTPQTYLNAGTLLFDFEKLRKNHMGADRLLSCASKNGGKLAYHDQDIFQEVMGEHTFWDTKNIGLYRFKGDNFFKKWVKKYRLNPVIIHGLSTSKPWLLHKSTLLGKIWKRDYDEVNYLLEGGQEYRQPTRIDFLRQHHWTLALCPNFLMPFVDWGVTKLKRSIKGQGNA